MPSNPIKVPSRPRKPIKPSMPTGAPPESVKKVLRNVPRTTLAELNRLFEKIDPKEIEISVYNSYTLQICHNQIKPSKPVSEARMATYRKKLAAYEQKMASWKEEYNKYIAAKKEYEKFQLIQQVNIIQERLNRLEA